MDKDFPKLLKALGLALTLVGLLGTFGSKRYPGVRESMSESGIGTYGGMFYMPWGMALLFGGLLLIGIGWLLGRRTRSA